MSDPVDIELERLKESGDTVCLLNYCNMVNLPAELTEYPLSGNIKRIYGKGNSLTKLVGTCTLYRSI